ncbi:MAG: TolC family protein [Nannocystaceae bacterium]|nr:TolC family protein [Nannocystaceae bacterium]
MTLQQATAYAREHAPDILRARARTKLGHAEQEVAGLRRYHPLVELGLGARVQAGAVGLDAEVSVSQRIEVSGQRRARKEAARRLQALQAAGVDVADWAVHAEVHLAFSSASLAQEALVLAQRRRTLAVTLQAMAASKVAAGEESAAALGLASAEVAWSQNAYTKAEMSVETAQLDLARAAGVADRPLRPRGSGAAGAVATDAARWVAAARERNPQLAQADAAIAFADARVEVAQREARPAPSVGVRIAREGSTSRPGNPSPAFNIVMGTVAVPIPALRRNRGEVARRTAEANVARLEQGVLLQQLNVVVRTACVRVDASSQRVLRLRTDVVGAFEGSLAALERSYAAGEQDFSSVAQSMQRLWTVREEVLRVRGEFHVALAQLEVLVGPLEPEVGAR